MQIIAISDTHSMHSKVTVPDGDVLIHAGDFTGTLANQAQEMIAFNAWLGALPHRVKLVVPGNHDKMCEVHTATARKLLTNATLLIDEEVTIDGIRFYGSPWTPAFRRWYFMRPRGIRLAEKWAQIPEGTDVLITHGPPSGVLDTVGRFSPGLGEYVDEHLGCEEMWKRVQVVRPQVHVFGHIHGGAGTASLDGIRYVNASVCDEDYQPANPARAFKIQSRGP